MVNSPYFRTHCISKTISATAYLTRNIVQSLPITPPYHIYLPNYERIIPSYFLSITSITTYRQEEMMPKWNSIASMGMYIVPYQSHTNSVSLLLNMETSLVYLQSHVKHDNLFDIVLTTDRNIPTLSCWQQLSGFTRYSPHHIHPQELLSGT